MCGTSVNTHPTNGQHDKEWPDADAHQRHLTYWQLQGCKLRANCADRADALRMRAIRHDRLHRKLHLVSGVITMVSGGTATALITFLTGAEGAKIAASGAALCSGIVSFIVTMYFDPKDAQKMYQGAAAYGALQDKLETITERSDEGARVIVRGLRSSYRKLLNDYDRFLEPGRLTQLRLEGPDDSPIFSHRLLLSDYRN